MAGTDIEQYKDSTMEHNHTYYGNGCSGTQGSGTSCSTGIIQTFDNEDQKMGAFYNYQASTSDTGASIATKNMSVPDTFCPLGWQLPYSGTGGDYYDMSKTWKGLFDIYGYTDSTARKVQSYPLSYVLSGYISYPDGLLYFFTGTGLYWAGDVRGPNVAHRLNTWSSGLRPVEESHGKTLGFALRRVKSLSILSRFA